MIILLGGLAWHELLPQMANAVSCPSSGAKIEVCVDNQTSDTPTVWVAGNAISNEITCTGPAPILGAYQQAITLQANQQTCAPVPMSGGLVTGMYVHRIYYSPPPTLGTPTPGTPTPGPTPTPTPRAAQYQQGPVVFQPTVTGTPTLPRIQWVYNKTVLTVNSTGDSTCNDTNCQAAPGTCTLRQAVNKAGLGATARPVLINFNLPALSTIQLTSTGSGCGMLRLDQASTTTTNVTIDGTDPNGHPWIVGDRTAQQAGIQDTFPVTVDLMNLVQFHINKGGNTIKGLQVKNTTGGTPQAKDVLLVENVPSGQGDITIHSVRIDGGNTFDCQNGAPPCDTVNDLIDVNNSRTVTVRNTEGLSALDKGVKGIFGLAMVQVFDSWFHHNYHGNVQADGDAQVSVNDSIVELAGRRSTDNASMYSDANGIIANGAKVFSARNIVERNRAHGLVVRQSAPTGSFDRDVTCGNGNSGLFVEGGSSNVSLTSNGVGSVFNGQRGVLLKASVASVAPFMSSNAFVNNNASGSCEFENDGAAVTVNDDQWTNGSAHTCGSATVTVSSIQDAVNVDIPATLTADTTNLLLAGQTVRIVGSGFNAANGNTRSGNCALGDDSTANACCKKGPHQSNTCDQTGKPPAGSGQCLQILDRLGTWHSMTVEAVNPSLIVSSIPSDAGSIFPCLGSDSFIRVTKLTSSGSDTGVASYCTNDRPVQF